MSLALKITNLLQKQKKSCVNILYYFLQFFDCDSFTTGQLMSHCCTRTHTYIYDGHVAVQG